MPQETTKFERKCGNCAHWHQNAIDPQNLGKVRDGQCRQQLHSVAILNPGGFQILVLYPNVPATFDPCGQWGTREEDKIIR